MKILVINAGSSSLKYQLFDMDAGTVPAKGLCEKIGLTGAITHKRPGFDNYEADYPMPSHTEALALVLKLLTDEQYGVLKSTDEITAVGHRFAHGGKFADSCVLGDEEIHYLESIIPINPLHGPPALKGVAACKALMPGKPQIGVFDTSFYSGLEEKAYIYPVPYEWYEKYGVRRYGFHGTSHRYVSAKAAEFLGLDYNKIKIVSCHIGSGSSITAVKNGKAVDTSLGFTPQEGLPMGTRSGSIDPSIIAYVVEQTGMSVAEVNDILNKKSGLLGMSGVSNDARDVWAAADEGNHRAQLAMEVLVHYIKKIIGSYVAEMNGVDVIIFTAGLGENDRKVREMVCENMEYLGVKFDKECNATCPRGQNVVLSTPDSPVKVVLIPTDEEYMIAGDTYRLVK
ncbi:MAG: acetate kinase [Clostridia bacterium]|nr:acetate kinase [Clostridia bacterium]